MWQAAEAYFESLDDAHMVLPGGRYSCAQALVSRGLEFLSGRSLGQVCHIVQLAISQKKLLGYLNGAVVPYKRSQSMIKERCAEKQRPCSNTTRSSSSDLADWEKVKHGLKEILFSLSPGTSSIPLSNVKRLFRSRYHTELSETALGHSKLSELLQDPRLKDICHVRLQGHGYVVGPASGPLAKGQVQMNCHQGYQGYQGHQGGHQGHQGHHANQTNQAHQSTHQQPLMQVPVAPAPQGGPKCGNGMPHSSLGMHMGQVQSVAAAGAAAVSQAMRDAATRPENKGNKFYSTYDNSGDRPSLRDRAHFVPPLSMEDVETEAPPRPVPWKPPSPAAGSLRSRRDHFEASGLSVDDMNLPGVPSTPLPLMPATPDTPGFPKWNRMTQTPEALRAYSPMPIHNTFINYPMPPPTPNPCQGRSQSLPRNLSRMEDEGLDWSKSEALSSHPANRLMSAAAAAAGPGSNPKAPHPISAGCTQPGVSNSPGFHPQNYTNPGASTIRLADLL